MTRKRRRTHRRTIIISAVLLTGLSVVLGFWFLGENLNPDFQKFRDHYVETMDELNSSEVRLNMMSQLDRKYNFTDLFTWEHNRLTFGSDPEGWLEDPMEILKSGRGVCAQFSIVYVSACLALDIQSRLVIAANTTNWQPIHFWAEVNINGTWIHIDPSDQVWNSPSRYQKWDWGAGIGRDVKICAFEPGKWEDVTQRYETV
jgi:hypothetical protein